MTRVTSTEFQQAVGNYSDAAMREPVIITTHNRDRLVLMSVEEYARLKALDTVDDATAKLIEERGEANREILEKLSLR